MGENTKEKKIIVAVGYNEEKKIVESIKQNLVDDLNYYEHLEKLKKFLNTQCKNLSEKSLNPEKIKSLCDAFITYNNILTVKKINDSICIKLGTNKKKQEIIKTATIGDKKEFIREINELKTNIEEELEKYRKYKNNELEIYDTIELLKKHSGNENCEIIDYEELNLEEIKESNKDSVNEIIFVSHNSAGSDKITIKENTEHKKEDILENLIQIWKEVKNKENIPPLTIYACKALEQYSDIIRKKAETDSEIADLEIQASVFGLHPNMYYGKDKISDSEEINKFLLDAKLNEKPIVVDGIPALVDKFKKKEKKLDELFNEIDKVYKNFIQNTKNTTIKEINDNDTKDEETKAKQQISQMLDSVFNELNMDTKQQER